MKKKTFNYILILSLIFSLLAQTGCKKKSEDGLVVYYINQQSTKLLTDPFNPKADKEEEILVEMFDKLQSKPSDVDMFEAIPDKVSVIKTDIDTKTRTLTVNFSKDYDEIDKATEILTRAAIVLTLTQLDSVSYVDFLVDGQRLLNSDEEVIGPMSENSFADISAGSKIANSTKSDFIIYFANEDYSMWMNESMPQGYFCDAIYANGACDSGDAITVSRYTDDIADITVKVQFSAEGDMNNDAAFNIAVAYQMLGETDLALDWARYSKEKYFFREVQQLILYLENPRKP